MDELTKRIARLVAAYVEHIWPHTERTGGTPDEPMQTAKGSTNPPFGDYAHRILDSNRVASDYLYAALEETSNCSVKSKLGVPFSEVLMDLRYDPGLIQTWRDRHPSRYAAFKECCEHVARGVVYIFRRTKAEREEMERRLNLDPDYRSRKPDGSDNPDDPDDGRHALCVRRHPEDEEESRGRTRTGQKIDTMHTRRLMVEQLEQVEASTGYTGLEAMEILSERKAREGKDWSVAKIRRARTEINRERETEGAA